jgi:acetyl esterase
MTMDPQIAALLAHAPPYPGARVIPLDVLRGVVRDFARASPRSDQGLAKVENLDIARGDGSRLGLRLYHPSDVTGPAPVLLFLHGGGFLLGDLDSDDGIARALCRATRCLTVSVDYRLAPEHPFPAALDDAATALTWVAAHGRAHGGDPARLAVAGSSAGAVLAAALTLRNRDEGGPGLAAQLLFYGSGGAPGGETASLAAFRDGPILTADDMDYFWSLYLAGADAGQPYASPRTAQSHAGLPPAFVATAELDPSRDDGEDYACRLEASGVPVRLTRRTGMVHGFLSWLGMVDEAQAALDEASQWLGRQWPAN